ncbi:MAG TPA: flagellin [Terriglobales bacterium]|nr:flagellin [Terriglobales bacterium]
MALTILNNIAAIAAENQLNITSGNLQSTLEQLSSGSRINSGADDPAGLAIANGLSANIAALTQSSSNATGGIGELQVADGALSQVTTLLNRAVTLATESATGTVSDPQRLALDNEYQSIKTEINSIGSTTNYNGGQVFTASTLNVFLGDGSATGSSLIGVSTGLLSANGLNLGGATAAAGTLTQTAGSAAVAATNTLTNTADFVGSTAATDTLTFGGTWSATLGVGDTVAVGGKTYTFAADASGVANTVAIGANQQGSINNLTAAINATAGGAGVAYGVGTVANAQVSAVATSGTVLTVTQRNNGLVPTITGTGDTPVGGSTETYTWAAVAAGTNGDTVTVGGKAYQFVTALSNNATANEVVVNANTVTTLNNLAAAVNQGTGAGTTYGTGTTQNANVAAGTAAGTSPAGTLIFTANNAGTAGNFITGVASAHGTFAGSAGGGLFTGGLNAGAAPSAAAGDTVSVGGTTYTFVNALSSTAVANQVLLEATDAASLSNLANAVNGGTGLGATYSTGTVANTNVTAATGTNLTTGLDTITFTASTKGLAGDSIATAATGTAHTFAGSVLTGGAAGSVNDLLTQSDAQAALSLIDGAVAQVAALRGNIGATVNRLQSASNVINNQVQNLTSAENTVTAADIPTAVANLTQFSILEQTGISALAQANQQQQLVLKLLQ